jgi:ribonuclease R
MLMDHYGDRVLALTGEAAYTPLTLKAIARRLQVPPEDYTELRAEVKELLRQGKLELRRDKTIRRPDHPDAIIGLFRRSARGFGFVRPHSAKGRDDQIYIPPEATSDASSGDEVVVKITKRPRKGGKNLEGRVVRILARASGLFVGTYFEDGLAGYVKVDGTTFHDPVYVGDPGAKGARPGDKVVLEMVRYPTPYLEGEGVITEILGARGSPGVDTLAIIRAFNLPDVFEEVVLDEARQQAKQFAEDELGNRLDLRGMLTVTIDPATARDFDDAISLSRDDQGHWSLGVHIADVGHFVKPGSALDRAARLRGTSVYLPDRVLPMLPEVISNSLASLQAGRTRYALSVLLELSPEGVVMECRFARSAIRVEQRFTYEQAQEIMVNPDRSPKETTAEVAGMLRLMLELAMILRQRRFARGALELNLPEVEIELGDQGEVAHARLLRHDESHQVIEEFMLAANEAVASYLSERQVPFLRRAHADPEPHKLEEFAEFVRSLGLTLELPQSRHELQRILREACGRPEEHAVHYGLLRSLKQAAYTPEHEGHYALASQNYCHFTSPIRRYPDLQVHRQLTALLEGRKPKGKLDELLVLGDHCTRMERRAEAAERELIRVKLLTHLETRIGESFHAIVIGVEDFGLFCRLVELPVEGLIHVTSLGDDFYYLEPGTHTLVGRRGGCRHRLGDRLEVRIAHVDVDRRELDLVPSQAPLARGRRSQRTPPALRPPQPAHDPRSRRPQARQSAEKPRGSVVPMPKKTKKGNSKLRKKARKRKP